MKLYNNYVRSEMWTWLEIWKRILGKPRLIYTSWVVLLICQSEHLKGSLQVRIRKSTELNGSKIGSLLHKECIVYSVKMGQESCGYWQHVSKIRGWPAPRLSWRISSFPSLPIPPHPLIQNINIDCCKTNSIHNIKKGK